jgi:hypothetical protein
MYKSLEARIMRNQGWRARPGIFGTSENNSENFQNFQKFQPELYDLDPAQIHQQKLVKLNLQGLGH